MNKNSKQLQDDQLAHPMNLFMHEMSKKQLKLNSLSTISTISIALGRKQTKQLLIPYLASIFVQQNNQVKIAIIKSLTQLLNQEYIGKAHNSCCVLEIIIDILCVYSKKQIRTEAYNCLERVLSFMDVRKAQKILINALKKLNQDVSQEDEKQKNTIDVNENIKQLILRIIPYIYMGVDTENQKQLLQILNSYKNSLKDLKMVAQVLKQFIKVMPPAPELYIRQIIQLLLDKKDYTINNLLIEPIILLTKISGEESTLCYLNKILEDCDAKVLCTLFRNFNELNLLFSKQNLKPIYDKLEQYQSQPQQVRNCILQMIDSLNISQEKRKILLQPPSSLQLKNTLGETLCRLQDCSSLQKLLQSSDNNYRIKIFPQLPPINQLHISVMEQILKNKSWRPKLGILQNINKRTKEHENTIILIPVLCSFLGDKIAVIRSTIAECLCLIIQQNKIGFPEMYSYLGKSFDSRNWFERQVALRIIELTLHKNCFQGQKELIKKVVEKTASDRVKNVSSIADNILLKL